MKKNKMSYFTKFIYSITQNLRKLGFNFHEENDPRVKEMLLNIQHLGGIIEFKIEQYPDGSWTAESLNVNGIITGGENMKTISAIIKDAIFTYFEIPPQLCNDSLFKTDNEPVVLRRRVYVAS